MKPWGDRGWGRRGAGQPGVAQATGPHESDRLVASHRSYSPASEKREESGLW